MAPKTLQEYLDTTYPSYPVEPDPEGGFVVVFPDLPGCATVAETSEEIHLNGQCASEHLAAPARAGRQHARPLRLGAVRAPETMKRLPRRSLRWRSPHGTRTEVAESPGASSWVLRAARGGSPSLQPAVGPVRHRQAGECAARLAALSAPWAGDRGKGVSRPTRASAGAPAPPLGGLERVDGHHGHELLARCLA